MSIIHIAPDIGYLFAPRFSYVLCGQQAQKVFDKGEFIGLENNLNSKCTVCQACLLEAEGKYE